MRTLAAGVLTILLVACSSEGNPPTPPVPGMVTYHADVAPIVQENCVTCHVTGAIAPFPLTSYAEVAEHAGAIADATRARLMPPWNVDNSGACGEYHDARWLTEEQIDTLGRWAAAGAPEGDPALAPSGAPPTVEHLPETSPTLDPGFDYVPQFMQNGSTDDMRCFLVDPALTEDAFLTALEVLPGEPRMVHHLLLFNLLTAAGEDEAAALDEADADPGWSCFGTPGTSGLSFGVAGAWAPGVSTVRMPAGTGLRLVAGRKIIVQIHYSMYEIGTAVSDRTRVRLELAPTVQREGVFLGTVDTSLVLPPGQAEVTFSYDFPFDLYRSFLGITEYELLGVFPHMHTLGRKQGLTVKRAGAETCAMDVPRWDFHWQQLHFFKQPITLGSGDVLGVTCTYDTTTRSETTLFGESTNEEMCIIGFYGVVTKRE